MATSPVGIQAMPQSLDKDRPVSCQHPLGPRASVPQAGGANSIMASKNAGCSRFRRFYVTFLVLLFGGYPVPSRNKRAFYADKG